LIVFTHKLTTSQNENQFCLRLPQRTLSRRRGAIAVLAAVLMTFLLVMVAFVVDVGFLAVVKTAAQATADASAMAGSRGLMVSPAQVRTLAKNCAALNKANGQAVTLQDSDIVLGTWSPTNQTFTALTGTAELNANSVQVNVPLTAARGNSVGLFFGKAINQSAVDISASAVASTTKRWDVIVAQDISASYASNLSYAIQGTQSLVDNFNKYSPNSMFGVTQHTGWGSTWAPLQAVGTNYTSLRTTVGNLKDAQSPTSGVTYSGGGPGKTPPTSGSDLSTGIQVAINMFNSTAYTSVVPTGTLKAIIVSDDGASNASNNGQHPASSYSDTQLDTLAKQACDTAWSQGISVFVVLYYHSGFSYDVTLLQSLVRGRGMFISVTDPTQLPTAMNTIFANGLGCGLVK
jgi:Flp pilus assembly protein TadG